MGFGHISQSLLRFSFHSGAASLVSGGKKGRAWFTWCVMNINEGISKHAHLQQDIDHTDVILLYHCITVSICPCHVFRRSKSFHCDTGIIHSTGRYQEVSWLAVGMSTLADLSSSFKTCSKVVHWWTGPDHAWLSAFVLFQWYERQESETNLHWFALI